jgi:Gnt-I system high-affinity gluconate transporter/Gnt-II system L-idonate transporter
MFYNAGFIVLIPLAFSVAGATRQPLVYVVIAMASALSVTHGFLPPHPGPSAIVVIFKADIGKTLLYGFIVAVPALLLAGAVFPEFIKKIKANPPKGIFRAEQPEGAVLPGFGLSLFTALIPVILMGTATAAKVVLPAGSKTASVLQFIGDPAIALLVSVFTALLLLGVARGMHIKQLIDKSETALTAVATIILVIAAGGVFKQVLTDSGTGAVLTAYFKGSTMPPLLLGWLVATIIRVSIGSATVAALTAAGIVQPLLGPMHVHPELMVLSIGAGSLMCSHVNDTGFWMFKEYLGLSLADTFRSWTVMETIVGTTGLIGVLILNSLV